MNHIEVNQEQTQTNQFNQIELNIEKTKEDNFIKKFVSFLDKPEKLTPDVFS